MHAIEVLTSSPSVQTIHYHADKCLLLSTGSYETDKQQMIRLVRSQISDSPTPLPSKISCVFLNLRLGWGTFTIPRANTTIELNWTSIFMIMIFFVIDKSSSCDALKASFHLIGQIWLSNFSKKLQFSP